LAFQLLVGALVLAGWVGTLAVVEDVRLWDGETMRLLGRYLWQRREMPSWLLVPFLGWAAAGVVVVAAAQSLSWGDDYGQARWAKVAELRKMGLRAAHGFVFGRLGRLWRAVLRSDALSAIVLGPAGTGKTSCVIIPSILSLGRRCSAFVHDTKGELAEATAGARAALGPVYIINMAAGAARSACWNPLASTEVPSDGPGRGDLVDRYWQLLIPGPPTDFWVASSRLLGAAATLYKIYEAEAAGQDTSFRAVLSWLSNLRVLAEAQAAEDGGELEGDPVRDALEDAMWTVRENGWPERISDGLAQMASFDARSRSNIMGTVFAFMGFFLNENIAECTARCDFSIADYRGTGSRLRRRPITTYWKAPPFDADLYGRIAGMHAEAVARRHTESGEPPADQLDIALVLDEARFMPKLRAIEDGPSIVRSFRIRFLVAFQDKAQAILVYGRDAFDAMWTNYGYRIIFPQNHLETARFISDSIGKTTRRRRNRTWQLGRGGGSEGEALEGQPLILPQEIMSMPRGRVIVQAQYHGQTPVMAKAAHYKGLRVGRLAYKPLSKDLLAALGKVNDAAEGARAGSGAAAPSPAPVRMPAIPLKRPEPAPKAAKPKGKGKSGKAAASTGPMDDDEIAALLK